MPRTTQERNAALFIELLRRSGIDPTGKWRYHRLKSDGYIDLSIDRLGGNEQCIMFALAHNSIQNGDVMADPDMGVSFYPGTAPRLQATHYQNDYLPFYESVEHYPEGSVARRKCQESMDTFMEGWLSTLIDQGHVLDPSHSK